MLQVLQRVLEQLQQRRTSSWMMRNHSRIPRCSVGDVCVLKKGSRVGQLCECPQSSRCSMFFHKCLPTGF
ncbi:hypothetical protein QQF64_009089 [Cirrhinus molitorella]|uniref:Cocaine- and amphetamine-regulated transcript protein n=1 Tax=Cirrhinus molitorella TaxID=172907 RepID=A0ABR3M064_9TELE